MPACASSSPWTSSITDSLAGALAHVYALPHGRSALRLGPIEALLSALGHPERRLRAIGVAGTNGKGSSSALLAATLRAAGQRVGLFTSPHLLRYAERIRLEGAPLPDAELIAGVTTVARAAAELAEPVSFFEFTTALAAHVFAAAAVDWAVFEVGLGGRLDATRAVPRQLALITPIALDHCALLGDSLAAIAGEKAGIIAPGRPVVVAPQPAEAGAVLVAHAGAAGAPLLRAEAWGALPPHLPPYQAVNVGAVARAAGALGLPAAAFAQALADFHWPGRYQWCPGPPDLLLDGAHNPAAMAALVAAVRADSRLHGRPLSAIVGALATKEVGEMLQPLRRANIAVQPCLLPLPRSLGADAWRALCPEVEAAVDLPAALAAVQARQPGAPVLICGSLFLVAEAQAFVTGAPRDPPIAA